jgi:hypothetical protein
MHRRKGQAKTGNKCCSHFRRGNQNRV